VEGRREGGRNGGQAVVVLSLRAEVEFDGLLIINGDAL